MDIHEHIQELENLMHSIGGILETPPRKAPYLEVSMGRGFCRIRWNENRQAYDVLTDEGGKRTFRTPEEVMRWFRVEL